jgi:hypothetical protein
MSVRTDESPTGIGLQSARRVLQGVLSRDVSMPVRYYGSYDLSCVATLADFRVSVDVTMRALSLNSPIGHERIHGLLKSYMDKEDPYTNDEKAEEAVFAITVFFVLDAVNTIDHAVSIYRASDKQGYDAPGYDGPLRQRTEQEEELQGLIELVAYSFRVLGVPLDNPARNALWPDTVRG